MKLRHTFFLLALSTAVQARAQLRLPTLPIVPQITDRIRPITQPLLERRQQLLAPLDLRRLGDDLLDRHPKQLSRDPAGQLIVRAELLALPSSAEARGRLLALPGVTLIEETELEGLDLRWLRLRGDTALLAQLRALDPQGQYDYQHIYLGSGATGPSAPSTNAVSAGTDASSNLRIGLIDSGVALSHPALRAAHIERWGCDGPAVDHPAAHGTAVASLLVGADGRFKGAAVGAKLYAADAYCDAPDGGSVLRMAKALAWLAREKVGVVNISLVGPANLLLAKAVAAAQSHGLLIVAAVGNDGPAAPPLYPAAWPGVVAVTGVDPRRRVLAEAGRGPHVMFAAPGSGLWGADVDGGYAELRGTSFAAPLVAALLARESVEGLRATAIDLGATGRDEVYGWGLVAEAQRTQKR